MKTIRDLNNTAWFRALKVVYISLLVGITSFVILTAYFEGEFETLDIANRKIVCQYGNEKTFLVRDVFDEGEMSSRNYYQLPDAQSQRILELCEIEDVVVEAMKTELGAKIVGEYGMRPIGYSIEDTYKTRYDYLVLTFVIITGTFELLRRAFYYVVLGSIRPKKQ